MDNEHSPEAKKYNRDMARFRDPQAWSAGATPERGKAPLWPKPALAPTDEKWPDAHPVRERAAKDLEESAPTPEVEKLAEEIARLNKACDAFSNAEILSGDWKARAEKAEAERDQLRTQLEAWHSLFGTTQLSHAIAERDQLRTQLAASEARHADAQTAIRNGLEREGALKAQLAAAQRDRERLAELLAATARYVPTKALFGDILNKPVAETNLLGQIRAAMQEARR